jgi:hypothetical protein
MPMTIEEIGKSVQKKYPQYAGQDPATVGKAVLEKYPQYSRALNDSPAKAVAQTQQPEQKGPGLVQSLVQGVAKPFLKLGTNVLNFGEGAIDLAQGKVAQAGEAANKTRDYGYFGQNIAPVGGTSNKIGVGDFAKDVIGTGAEIGSYLAPVGVGGALASKAPALAKVGAGAGFGALGGALGSGGAELQEKDSNISSVLGSAATGSLAGAAIGAAFPIAGEVAGKAGQAIKPLLSEEGRIASAKAANLKALNGIVDSNKTLRDTVVKHSAQGVDSKSVLANTDFLRGSVSTDGKIRTLTPGGAFDKISEVISPYEDIVSKTLKEEGRSISPEEVARELRRQVEQSGISGADKATALAHIDREVQGLMLDALPDGSIPLDALHKAKVYKYKVVGESFGDATKKTYDKAVGSALKDIIERYSSANIKGLNSELQKLYSVRSLVKKLDGKVVRGGRLGKYSAQLLGGLVGSHVGGPVGAIAGADIGRRAQGALLARTFARKTGGTLEVPNILKEAVKTRPKPSIVPESRRLMAPAMVTPPPKDTSRILSQEEIRKLYPNLGGSPVKKEMLALPAPAIRTPAPKDTSGILPQEAAVAYLKKLGYKGRLTLTEKQKSILAMTNSLLKKAKQYKSLDNFIAANKASSGMTKAKLTEIFNKAKGM